MANKSECPPIGDVTFKTWEITGTEITLKINVGESVGEGERKGIEKYHLIVTNVADNRLVSEEDLNNSYGLKTIKDLEVDTEYELQLTAYYLNNCGEHTQYKTVRTAESFKQAPVMA